jgi:putative membrane protein
MEPIQPSGRQTDDDNWVKALSRAVYPREMADGAPSKWTDRLLRTGTDPDPRFSLANERTFLAWIRTGLGLIALGVGVATFVSSQMAKGVSILLAAGLVLLGGIISAASWFRWVRVERSMRDAGMPLPSRMAPVLAFGIAALAVLSIVGVVLAR